MHAASGGGCAGGARGLNRRGVYLQGGSGPREPQRGRADGYGADMADRGGVPLAAEGAVRGGEGGETEYGSDGGSDVDMDAEEELDLEELRRMRAERQRREVEDDLNFPDEMDTPHDVPARVCAV